MTYDRKFGQKDGLADRLDAHAERLAKDKSTPWLGLGLYDDLRAAAAVLDGRPLPAPRGGGPAEKPKLEFDL